MNVHQNARLTPSGRALMAAQNEADVRVTGILVIFCDPGEPCAGFGPLRHRGGKKDS